MKKRKSRKSEGSEEENRLFKELCEAVNRLGVETRVEKGNFRGGICLVEGEKEMLFVNKKHPVDRRIALILSEINKLDSIKKSLPKELLSKIEESI